MQCIICKKEVVFENLIETDVYEYVSYIADHHGVDALTENLQLVYERSICGELCFHKLD